MAVKREDLIEIIESSGPFITVSLEDDSLRWFSEHELLLP